jgi:hypothetical protein
MQVYGKARDIYEKETTFVFADDSNGHKRFGGVWQHNRGYDESVRHDIRYDI